MTTYAVAGASGQLGRLATGELLQRADPADVTLLTRTPGALDAYAARGARVRAADLADPATMRAALAGVDRLLLISAALIGEPRRAAQRGAVDAAQAAGVSFVAYTSAPRPSAANPSIVVQDHFDTEQYLRASGLRWAMLRNNIYADLVPAEIRPALESGQLVTNYGSGRVAYISRADCAASAAAVLAGPTDDAAAGGRDYEITGSEALGSRDLADLAAAQFGRQVEVVDVDDATMRARLLGQGLPEPMADLVTTFGTAIREGLFAEVATTVHDLTGRAPVTVRDLLGIPARQ